MLRRNKENFDKMLTIGNEKDVMTCNAHWGSGVPTPPGTAGHLPNIHCLFPACPQDLGFFQVGNVSVTSVTSLDPLQLKLAL